MEVFYELFNPKNLSETLDINLCSQNYIEIRLPLVLKQYKMDLIQRTRDLGYNIFDLNNSFYNDICSSFSYNNSDFSLSERKKLLDLSDENLTMSGCNYTSFDIKTIRVIYLCKIGNDVNNNNSVSEVNINDNKEDNILKNIVFSKASNIKIVKCFSILINSKIFYENYGFYIMLFTNILIILLLIFSFPSKLDKQLKIFCNTILSQMKKIYYNTQNRINLKIKNDKINEKTNVVNDKTNDIENSIRLSIDTSFNNENIKENSSQRDVNKNKIKNNPNRDINPINKDSSIIEKIKIDRSNIDLNNLDNINNGKNKSNNNDEDKHKIIDKLRKKHSNLYLFYVIKYIPFKKRKKYFSESEMENLSYDDALDIENRNKSDIYFSLLREKNKLVSIFLNDEDFNIHTVKIALFIFNFNLSLAVNALFFTDEAIYEINQDEGSFSLSTQISRIVYSAVISIVINYFVELLAFTHNSIIKLRYYEDIKKAGESVPTLLRILKIKLWYFLLLLYFLILYFCIILQFSVLFIQ